MQMSTVSRHSIPTVARWNFPKRKYLVVQQRQERAGEYCRYGSCEFMILRPPNNTLLRTRGSSRSAHWIVERLVWSYPLDRRCRELDYALINFQNRPPDYQPTLRRIA